MAKKLKSNKALAKPVTKDKIRVLTAGAVSPSVASGINVGLCVNANLAGNAAAIDQSSG